MTNETIYWLSLAGMMIGVLVVGMAIGMRIGHGRGHEEGYLDGFEDARNGVAGPPMRTDNSEDYRNTGLSVGRNKVPHGRDKYGILNADVLEVK